LIRGREIYLEFQQAILLAFLRGEKPDEYTGNARNSEREEGADCL
jgi:hypothetical protein